MRGHNGSLKVSSFPSLQLFFSLSIYIYIFPSVWKKEDVKRKHLKEMGKSKSQNERSNENLNISSFPFLHFFSSMVFFSLCFFFPYVWGEEDAKRKCLKRKGKSKRVEVRTKNERAERKVEGEFPSFFAFFFFSMVFFFFYLRRRRCKEKAFETEMQKQEGKSERAHRKFEGKLPPFSWFFLYCFLVCFIFSMFEEKKTIAMCHRFLLWWCSNEKGDDNSSLAVLRFNLMGFWCL